MPKKIILSCIFCLSLFGTTIAQEETKHEKDSGSKSPANLVKNQITNAIASLEKELPKTQRLRILGEARIYAQNLDGNDRDAAIFRIANQYRRFNLTKEAKTLFASVVDKSNNPDFKIRSGMAIAEIEFLKEKDMKRAIESLEKSLVVAQSNGLDDQTVKVLIRTGSYYFIDEQFDKMIDVFDEFNALPEELKAKFPREHLKANLYSGRTLREQNDSRADNYFSRVESILERSKEGTFELDLFLSLALETAPSNQRWNAAKRIQKLLKLFNNKMHEKEMEICFVGNEIFWAYFLERDAQWKRYQDFQQQFSTLLAKQSKNEKQIVPLRVQTIGAHAYACKEHDKPVDRDKMVETLNEISSKIKRLDARLPNKISRQERQEFSAAIRDGLVDVLQFNPAKMKQIPPVKEPTPASKPNEKRK